MIVGPVILNLTIRSFNFETFDTDVISASIKMNPTRPIKLEQRPNIVAIGKAAIVIQLSGVPLAVILRANRY